MQLKNILHIDIETYSSVDIRTSGVYKYCESVDFEILIICYAHNDESIIRIDMTKRDEIPETFLAMLLNPHIEKHAHNAAFERTCFAAYGYIVPINQWFCTMIKAAYCGLPLGLSQVSEALKLEEKGKLATGRALIRFFSCPIKPTKTNGGRVRNFPSDDIDKWNDYIYYCVMDVEAEREIEHQLRHYEIPLMERQMYILDQEINDRGIMVDFQMAEVAININDIHSTNLKQKLKDLTGLENPNSPAQLKTWLSKALNKNVTTLAKDATPGLLKDAGAGPASEVLKLRAKSSKTSIKKYITMLNCMCEDLRVYGLFQFYGANRTGRWAGRLVQIQNLPQNHLDDLEGTRTTFVTQTYQNIIMLYEDVSSTLSQLIRTAFIAKKYHTFVVADFSAIEARVIAWLAGEWWRMDVFSSHGKIYEASASLMFNIPIEQIKKGSEYRDKGKVAELALGYGGSIGALKNMGGEKMGLSDSDMKSIVAKWRKASPEIVKLWKALESGAIRAIRTRKKQVLPKYRNLAFDFDGWALTIELPSGRKLFYQGAVIAPNKWGNPSVKYKGVDQVTRKWWWTDTYGGKLAENVVQAIARDLLADSMIRINKEGFDIVMHVHDEVVAEVLDTDYTTDRLDQMCQIMGEDISWAKGLDLKADGYITPFYKKD